MATDPTRVAIVGLGRHGAGVAALLPLAGYQFAGAADIGKKVGRPVGEFVPGANPGLVVQGSLDALLTGTGSQVVVLAAAVSGDDAARQALAALRSGVNVVALHEDLLAPGPDWAEELDKAGKQTGASFVSTGAQDTWWIHLPALVAGSSVGVTAIDLQATVDVDTLPEVVGRAIGVGLSRDDFAPVAEALSAAPSVMTVPLREAARRMGLEPQEPLTSVAPVIAEEPAAWRTAGQTIGTGSVLGITQTTRLATDRGIIFTGTLSTTLLPGGRKAPDRVRVTGIPELNVAVDPFPGVGIINATVVNRIADVVAAPGGVWSAATLSPSRLHLG